MVNMKIPRHPMPSQAPDVRNKNFKEVALGYSAETAMERTHYLINATGTEGLVAAPSAPCHVEIYTPEGCRCRTLELPAGFVRLPVPCAGMAILKSDE